MTVARKRKVSQLQTIEKLNCMRLHARRSSFTDRWLPPIPCS